MPLTWIEDNESRSATIVRLGRKASSSMTRSYKVFGTTSDVEVHADANRKISRELRGWQYPGADVQLMAESYSISFLGGDAWQVTISYEKNGADDQDNRNPLRRSRSFDTSGGTQHITQAKAEKSWPRSFAFGGTGGQNGIPVAPSQWGAIGVDGDTVSGIDVVVPALTWTETYDVPSGYVTSNYIKAVAALTGTVNAGPFRSFAAGEVLFVGCSGSQEWDQERGDGPWTLSYKFTASPNAGVGQTLPPITDILPGEVIDKEGHEYLWISYGDDVYDGSRLKRPRLVYVNQVYRKENFGFLGIGS